MSSTLKISRSTFNISGSTRVCFKDQDLQEAWGKDLLKGWKNHRNQYFKIKKKYKKKKKRKSSIEDLSLSVNIYLKLAMKTVFYLKGAKHKIINDTRGNFNICLLLCSYTSIWNDENKRKEKASAYHKNAKRAKPCKN